MNTKLALSALVAALMLTACAKQEAASTERSRSRLRLPLKRPGSGCRLLTRRPLLRLPTAPAAPAWLTALPLRLPRCRSRRAAEAVSTLEA